MPAWPRFLEALGLAAKPVVVLKTRRSGLSFAGFVALRVLGGNRGWGLSGLLGDVISSTAVTLARARESWQSPGLGHAFALA
jgi:uncharacterized membrane protein (DUF4010 family)